MKFSSTNKLNVLILCVLLAFSFGVNADNDDSNDRDKGEKSSEQKRHDDKDNHVETRDTSTAINSPEEVIENYFTALQSGDTVEIRKTLGGNLLKNRARLLSNPTYPLTLQEWYRGANFTITGTYIIDANTVNVETSVSRSNTQQVKYSFTLTKNNSGAFHITDETEILN